MIDFFRNNKQSFGGVIMVGMMALLMLSFGVGKYDKNRAQEPVIKVDGRDVNPDEYYRKFEQLQNTAREQLGKDYNKYRGMLRLEEKTSDGIITETLTDHFVNRLGLTASVRQIEDKISSSPIFAKGITPENYQYFLRVQGLTGLELETDTRQDIAAEQLQNALADVALPSQQELKAAYLNENAKIGVGYMAFKPEDFEKQVDVADAAKLQEYYEKHSEKYRRPKSVSYSFVEFDPAKYLSNVDVADSDLQDAYQQRKAEFAEPKKVKLSRILVKRAGQKEGLAALLDDKKGDEDRNVENGDSDKAKEAVADDALRRIKAGEKFEDVASQVSDDKESAKKGGDIGWTNFAPLSSRIRFALNDLQTGKVTEVLNEPEGFLIIRLDQIKEPGYAPFETVKGKLEDELRKGEAPVYARIQADNFLSRWLASDETKNMPLAAYAAKQQMKALSTDKLLTPSEDPEGAPKGLTEKVSKYIKGDREAIQVGSRDFVIEVQDLKEAFIPDFQEVKENVTKEYVTATSNRLAKEAADAAMTRLRAAATATTTPESAVSQPAVREPQLALEKYAKEHKLPYLPGGELTRSEQPTEPLLQEPQIREAILTLNLSHQMPDRVLTGPDGFYLFELTQYTPPPENEFAARRSALQSGEADKVKARLGTYLIQTLKAGADIWVDPTFLNKTHSGTDDYPTDLG